MMGKIETSPGPYDNLSDKDKSEINQAVELWNNGERWIKSCN